MYWAVLLFYCVLILSSFYSDSLRNWYNSDPLKLALSKKDPPLMNILTRTSGRKSCFEKLRRSLDQQTYPRRRHIVGNDRKDAYVGGLPDVVSMTPDHNAGKCFYNIYLNTLWKQVREGWVMFLDDDAFMFDNGFLERVAKKCATLDPKTLLVVHSYYGPHKSVLPRKLRRGYIDMANICVHSSCPYRFDGNCGGDWRLIEKILNDPSYKVVHMTRPFGVWANYMGKANGKKLECL